MSNKIGNVFSDMTGIHEADTRLLARVTQYQLSFANKNSEHIEFFGGHLTGVHTVRFNPSDRARWFEEVVGFRQPVDEFDLQDTLFSLKLDPTDPEFDKKDDSKNYIINKNFKVVSDVMNLSCVWLCHLFTVSTKLNEKQKKLGQVAVLLILHYKYLTSLLYRYFSFLTTPEIAEATYAKLSKKFMLKECGSWGALLELRSEDIVAHSSIHLKTLTKFDADDKILYILSDSQGRVRAMLKNIYGVFKQVHANKERILTSSYLVEHDGDSILKDKIKSEAVYPQYLKSIIADENSFIRPELTSIILKVVSAMPEKIFTKTLEWMSDHYGSGNKEIDEVLTDAIVHCFEYLSRNPTALKSRNDLPGLVQVMRGVYMSSRSAEPLLLSLRTRAEVIVRKATNNRNQGVVASVRTGLLLYIVLRAMTMHHYSTAKG